MVSMKNVLTIAGKAFVALSIPWFIMFIYVWITAYFWEASIGLIIGGLLLFLGSTLITEGEKMSIKYHRIPELDKVRYIQIRFRDRKEDNIILYEVSPVFSKYDGTYSFFIDSVLICMDNVKKEVVGLLDANKNPIPMSRFSFRTEKASGADDCGFVVAS